MTEVRRKTASFFLFVCLFYAMFFEGKKNNFVNRARLDWTGLNLDWTGLDLTDLDYRLTWLNGTKLNRTVFSSGISTLPGWVALFLEMCGRKQVIIILAL